MSIIPALSLRRFSLVSSRIHIANACILDRINGSAVTLSVIDSHVNVSLVPSDVAAVPGRAEGCRPAAPAIDASHRSRMYSIERDMVSAMSLRSFNKRSGGMLKDADSSSRLRTRKPMKLDMTSNAAASRCAMLE